MSWTDESPRPDIVACLQSADRLRPPSLAFRTRVLDEALRVRQRSLSLHRIQTLTTSLLAAGLLMFLPGYYRSLHEPVSWTAPPTVATSWTAASLPVPTVRTADAYEWALVQAALAERDESMRIIRGAL
uniref:Uncharacterized protein n=1 Tax=Schlesneria paludicola TaxID=360056 RepID=A0A7C2NWW4_9PLAN